MIMALNKNNNSEEFLLKIKHILYSDLLNLKFNQPFYYRYYKSSYDKVLRETYRLLDKNLTLPSELLECYNYEFDILIGNQSLKHFDCTAHTLSCRIGWLSLRVSEISNFTN